MAYNDYTTEQRLKKLLRLGREEIAKALKKKGKHTATSTDIAEAAIAAQHRKEANTDFSKDNDRNREQEQNILLNLLWFDAKAKKYGLDNSSYESLISSILKLFRDIVSRLGYNGRIKPFLEIVARYGTTKDKAALCIVHFDYTVYCDEGHNPVSKKFAEAIRAGIWGSDENTKREFTRYFCIYDAYTVSIDDYLNTRTEYVATIQTATLNIKNWEWASKSLEFEEQIKQDVAKILKKKLVKASVEHFEDITKEALNSAFTTAFNDIASKYKGTLLFDGNIDEASKLYDKTTKDDLDAITLDLSYLKGWIEGLQEFTKQHDSLIFTPCCIKKDIIDPKAALTLPQVPKRYYRTRLEGLAINNGHITGDEVDTAILPGYDTVQAYDEAKTNMLDTLNEEYEKRENRHKG